jgi:hypothetical protein
MDFRILPVMTIVERVIKIPRIRTELDLGVVAL